MSIIPFRKYHGFGNDYIVVIKAELGPKLDLEEFARSICSRNTGAGSDGIALIEEFKGDVADFSCRIINPDGSEAAFSGNGTRCATAHMYRKGLWSDKHLKLLTRSGVKNYEFLRLENGAYWFQAELGKPSFAEHEIPFVKTEKLSKIYFRDKRVYFGEMSFPVCLLNVGNPVCTVFVEDFDFDWRMLGAGIESHECFPERTNVVFVTVKNKSHVEIRIWERGAGETASSGTCSIAAAVAAAKTDRTERAVNVTSQGGITEAVWREDNEMLITGSAEYVYSGVWPVGEEL